MEQSNKANRAPKDEVLGEKLRALEPQAPAPASLKEEVFGTLDTLQLTAELFDFFTIKFSQAEITLLQAASPADEEE